MVFFAVGGDGGYAAVLYVVYVDVVFVDECYVVTVGRQGGVLLFPVCVEGGELVAAYGVDVVVGLVGATVYGLGVVVYE